MKAALHSFAADLHTHFMWNRLRYNYDSIGAWFCQVVFAAESEILTCVQRCARQDAFFEKSLDKYPWRVYNESCEKFDDFLGDIAFGKEVYILAEEKVCPCCHTTKHRSEEEQMRLIHRLSRIEGQIRGIRGMVEKDAYCTDILIQVSAANAALNAFNKELLASHIRTCVAEDIRAGKDEVIDDLVATLQKLMK